MPRLIHFLFLLKGVLFLVTLAIRHAAMWSQLTFPMFPQPECPLQAEVVGHSRFPVSFGSCKLQIQNPHHPPKVHADSLDSICSARDATISSRTGGPHRPPHNANGNAERSGKGEEGARLTVLLLVAGELQLAAQVGLSPSPGSQAGQGRCQQEEAEEEHLADWGEGSLAAVTGEAATPRLSPAWGRLRCGGSAWPALAAENRRVVST